MQHYTEGDDYYDPLKTHASVASGTIPRHMTTNSEMEEEEKD